MTRLHWDTSEIDRFAVDLSEAPGRVQRGASRALARGALGLKNRIQRAASGHDYLPYLDEYVSSERRGPLSYEVGFDKAGQGNLANIAAFGSINNAPVMASPYELALLELPEIERQLLDAGVDAILGGIR